MGDDLQSQGIVDGDPERQSPNKHLNTPRTSRETKRVSGDAWGGDGLRPEAHIAVESSNLHGLIRTHSPLVTILLTEVIPEVERRFRNFIRGRRTRGNTRDRAIGLETPATNFWTNRKTPLTREHKDKNIRKHSQGELFSEAQGPGKSAGWVCFAPSLRVQPLASPTQGLQADISPTPGLPSIR